LSHPLRSIVRHLNLIASTSLIALIVLCVIWELWLAPLRPGGSMLVLKVVPLLAPVFGIVHGRRYTYQWATLMILLYVAEGIVRATSDAGASVPLAWIELALSLTFFAAAVGYARLTRPPATISTTPR
jgi:uncharacterized membrane protein